MKSILIIVCGILALSHSAMASPSLFWNDNSPSSGEWSTGNNWATSAGGTPSTNPTGTDSVALTKSDSSYFISSSTTDATVANLDFTGTLFTAGYLDFSTYTLTVTGQTTLAGSFLGALVLNSGSFNLGSIQITGGQLVAGAANIINAANDLNFNAEGVFNINGYSQTLSSITLTSDGFIDMGPAPSTLTFSTGDFDTLGTNTLYIVDWQDGSHVYFLGGTSDSFSSAHISINGLPTEFNPSTFEVTPLPEPSTIALLLSTLVLGPTCFFSIQKST